MGHFAKLCRSKMPERTMPRQTQRTQQQTYNHSPGNNQARRVRHVTEQSQDIRQTNVDEESIDPESSLYLRELTEDWANINLVEQRIFNPVRNIILKKERKRRNLGSNNLQQFGEYRLACRYRIATRLHQPNNGQ